MEGGSGGGDAPGTAKRAGGSAAFSECLRKWHCRLLRVSGKQERNGRGARRSAFFAGRGLRLPAGIIPVVPEGCWSAAGLGPRKPGTGARPIQKGIDPGRFRGYFIGTSNSLRRAAACPRLPVISTRQTVKSSSLITLSS